MAKLQFGKQENMFSLRAPPAWRYFTRWRRGREVAIRATSPALILRHHPNAQGTKLARSISFVALEQWDLKW